MSKSRYPKARKRFGQNFLTDQSVIDDIIAAIDPKVGEHLVEIGPGHAALTLPLLKNSNKLDVVELDRDLIPLLKARLAAFSHLTVHEADALSFDYRRLLERDEKLRIIGNLPYNITTPLLFHLLEQATHIEDMCFMLQKEVVQRICAKPGNKQYGRLSVMVQYQCQTEMLFIVPPEAFDPAPKVESAIIYLRPLGEFVGGDLCKKSLGILVTQAFSQRRKTIANTLKKIVSKSMLEAQGIDVEQRPETVSVEQYVALTQAWIRKRDNENKEE